MLARAGTEAAHLIVRGIGRAPAVPRAGDTQGTAHVGVEHLNGDVAGRSRWRRIVALHTSRRVTQRFQFASERFPVRAIERHFLRLLARQGAHDVTT